MSNQWQPPSSGGAPGSPGQPSRRSDAPSAATAPAPPPSQRSTYDDFTALLAATAARGSGGTAGGGLDPRLLGNVRNQTVASLGGTLVHNSRSGRETSATTMNAPNAMNMTAGGWTTGGPTSQQGAEALRALALMGRLGVSPSGSALAAAVLPGAARSALGLDTESLLRRRQELIQQQQRHDARAREERARLHVQRERAQAQAERQPREERRSSPSKAGDPTARTRKQELYRSYREDNLDFYNDLVESHGREVADAIVREAVEEALGEETGGKGQGNGDNDEPQEQAPQGNHPRRGNPSRRGVICIEDSDDDETRKKAVKEAKVIHAHEKGGRTLRDALIGSAAAGKAFGTALALQPPQPHPQFSHLYKSDAAVASKKRSTDAAAQAQEGRDEAKRPKPQSQSAGHHHHHHHHHRDKHHSHHEKQPKQSQPTSGPAQALHHDLDRLRGQQQPSQAPAPAPTVGHDLLGKLQGKPSSQPMTAGGPAAPTVGHDLLRTLFPALSTSPPELGASPVPLFAAAGMTFGDASGTAARSRTHKVPPGFDEFRSDPEFCRLIVQSAYRARDQAAAGGSSDAGGLLFVRGLLNIDDESLKISSSNDSDPSLRAYVKDFINPFLNDPTSIVPQGGKLTSISRITSDNINYIARNVLYQRRKAMKSAVELAFHEIKSGQRASLPSMGGGGGNKGNADDALEWAKAMHVPASTTVVHAPDERKLKEKDDRIEELRRQLAHEKAARTKEVQKLQDAHAKEQKEVEAEYKGIVSALVKSHKKEKEELRKKLRNADSVHKTFLDSYVEASLDALRSPSESPGLE